MYTASVFRIGVLLHSEIYHTAETAHELVDGQLLFLSGTFIALLAGAAWLAIVVLGEIALESRHRTEDERRRRRRSGLTGPFVHLRIDGRRDTHRH